MDSETKSPAHRFLESLKLSRATVWAWATLFFFAVLSFLKPVFLTFDSYDYLELTVIPKFGSSHSMGFGLVLWTIARLADLTSPLFFTEFLLFWNSLGLGLICSFMWPAISDVFRANAQKLYRVTTGIVLALFCMFVLPGIIFVSNAVWSEATNFLQIGLFVLLVRATQKKSLYWTAPLAFCLSIWCYHTRYSEIVLPVALLANAVAFALKSFWARSAELKRIHRRKIRTYGVLFFASIVGIQVSNSVLSRILPVVNGQTSTTNLVLATSIQCALRCDVKLYQKADCSTPEGRALTEGTKCSELIFGLKDFGAPEYDSKASHFALFKKIGSLNTLKWLITAPFTYLTDTHDIEMGLFQFGAEKPAIQNFPDAYQTYAKYWAYDHELQPNKVFTDMAGKLGYWFRTKKFYHWLTVFSLFFCGYVFVKSKEDDAIFLAFVSSGTYLLFSYLNPHVPFRYLLIIIVPGMISVLLTMTKQCVSAKPVQ